jgi:T5SS/PEP-CTERM-associated repeat protein
MALLIGSTALTGVSLSLVGPARAGSPVWLGTASNDWFTAGNWIPAAVPNATDTVTIDTTSPNTTVINGGTAAAQQTFVGAASNGTLNIAGGGILNDAYGYLGYLQNSNGSVTVSGGSTWNNSGNLSVGRLGAGNLGITGGSIVTDVSASIGEGAGGSGVVTVAGAGSTWTNSADVFVGDAGTGSLTVSSGAGVTTAGNSFVGNLGTGAATVTGGGSTWAAGVNLVVGFGATGTLQVLQGGSVTATTTDIGSSVGTHGAATIDGGGSVLGTGTLTVGVDGIGQLTVSGGGRVNSTSAFLGYYGGSSGTASVTGAGSIWANNGSLSVGEGGTGALTIANGGIVTSLGAINIGTSAGVTGTVLVDGAGSGLGLNSNAALNVGAAGTGTLTITNGGTVAVVNAAVGFASGGTGSVLVDGAGSTLTTANVFAVGYAGSGTLVISNGGMVSTNTAALGVTPGASRGSAVIDGAGSSWAAGTLYVGDNSTGSVAVTHGGSLTNLSALIGASSGSNGSVTVDGAGSSWTNALIISIGDAGTGSVTIANGGAVSANGMLLIAKLAGSNGALNIGAAPGSAAAAPGTLTAASVQFGAGTGAINFNHTSASYLFSQDIIGNGAVNQLSGTTILTGNSAYTGPTTVDGGTLSVNGAIANSSTTVNAGGTLGGTGIVGDTTINGGVLAPGNSIGTLTIAGNLVLTTAASYMVEVSGASADKTVVVGAAQLAGTVVVKPTGRVAATTTYTILTSANTTGTFGSVSISNLAYARNARVSYSGNNVLLTLDPGLLSPSLPGFANINQRNVAAAIDNGLLAGGSMTTGLNTLFNATGQNLLNGLTQASGEVATGTQQSTFNAMGQFLNTLLDPFLGNRNDAGAPVSGASRYADDSAAAATRANMGRDAYAAIDRNARGVADSFTRRWSLWAAGYGGSQTTDGNTVVGSNTATSRIAGVAAGADYLLSPNTLVGFALGGGGTGFSVANGLGSGSSDLFQAGAFARHTIGNAYIAGALAYGWQDVTTDRTVTIAGVDHLRARFDANALSGRLEGGYRYATPWMGITPYAAAQFTTFYLPGYREQAISGANTFALNYAGRDVTASRGELGLRTDRSYALETAILTLRGRAAWAHDFNPDRAISATFQTLPGASFVVNGAAPAHESALVTGAAELKWMNGFSLSGTFEGEFSDVTRSYAGKGMVRYQW